MENSKIQWTESTHNFWTGCHKVSEGCKFCYMFRIKEANRQNPNEVIRTSQDYWYRPLFIKEPRLYFTCSMSDFFIPDADKWRDEAWKIIKETPQHTWQILTKRPERIIECLPKDWEDGYENVWLGVTIENQKNFHRAEILALIPARLRFISAEPLLDEIDFLVTAEDGKRIIDSFDWVILGGESGNDYGKYTYRKCDTRWFARALNDLKESTSVKVFIKQMGTYLAKFGKMGTRHGDNIEKFPKNLQIREMP